MADTGGTMPRPVETDNERADRLKEEARLAKEQREYRPGQPPPQQRPNTGPNGGVLTE